MRHLLILAAAAFLAVGCHQRTEDEAGAAPDQGDPSVTATDTSATVETDTTMGQLPSDADTSFVAPDTTFADPGMSPDTVGAQGEVQTGDTTSADTWTDTTTTETTTDTTAVDTYDTPADTTVQE